jgi:DNA-binding transcriptional LysR family regulator
MAKAANHLSTTQPTVSQAIADLEDAAGVRLFDRSTQGVVPTIYGDIMLKSAVEAFDALKQGMRGIEFSATSGAGDVWVGCAEIALYGFLPAVIQRVAKEHPKIVVHATINNPSDDHYQQLRDRQVDLIIGRSAQAHVDDDLLVETYTTWMSLRPEWLASGNYISCIAGSTYRYGAQRQPLKALPIDMGLKLPIALFTLKNRTVSPAVRLFIETARDVAKAVAKDP